jgi:[acyl-carrier-protein] S-malonyltransferase
MKVGLIFPGQGAQKVGMSKSFFESYACARELVEMASDQLSICFKKMLFDFDLDELSLTKNAQVAIFVASLAQYRVLRAEFCNLDVVVAAGLSLGEYSALVASEKMTFTDCLNLVKERGDSMHKACEITEGSMRAVIGLSESEVLKCTDLIANVNHSTQIVISGPIDELDTAQQRLLEYGARKVVPLKVSGAFHSKLMQSAYEHMSTLIDGSQFHTSECQLVVNVLGRVCRDGTSIKEALKAQITGVVRWADSMQALNKITDGAPIIELGPSKTLCAMNRKMGIGNTVSFEEVEDLKIIENLVKEKEFATRG